MGERRKARFGHFRRLQRMAGTTKRNVSPGERSTTLDSGGATLRLAIRYPYLMRKLVKVLGKTVAAFLLVATAALAVGVGRLVWHYEYEIGLPDHRKLATVSTAGGICSSGSEHIVIPLAAIPPVVRSAVLAAEEPDFYARSPINPFTELAGAVLFGHRPMGSAISNAVVRCLISLSPDCCWKTIDWHIGNAVLMYRVERDLPKDLIFELFLNEIWFGRNTYGAEAAANAYFGKSLSDLSVEEAAYLATIPRAPSRVGRDIEYGIRRRNLVLDRMAEAGAISAAQAQSAKQQHLRLQEAPAPI
jgi:penicillin-binding protein 1A